MSNNDEIEKLFSFKFKNYKVQSTKDEWHKLYSDLKWVNFWKFQFYSFNIFYLAVIVSIVSLVSVLLLTNNTQNSPKQEDVNLRDSVSAMRSDSVLPVIEPVHDIHDTIKDVSMEHIQKNTVKSKQLDGNSQDSIKSAKDTIAGRKDVFRVDKEDKGKMSQSNKKEQKTDFSNGLTDGDSLSSVIESGLIQDSIKDTSMDNLQNVSKSQNDTVTPKPRIRKVKRTTVIKSDAVIVRDTVDVTKKVK